MRPGMSGRKARSSLLLLLLLAVSALLPLLWASWSSSWLTSSNLSSSSALSEQANHETLARSLRDSLEKYFFPRDSPFTGQCNISSYEVVVHRGEVSSLKQSHGSLREYTLHVIRPTGDEIRCYREQNSTISYANEDLLFGARNGVSGARIWLNSKASQFALPPWHVRRMKPLCMKITKSISISPQVLYEQSKYDELSKNFYLFIFRDGLVFDRGAVAMSCGFFQQLNSCVNSFFKPNTKAWIKMRMILSALHAEWRDLLTKPRIHSQFEGQLYAMKISPFADLGEVSIARVKQIFVADTAWDYNYHHMMVESVPRLIRILPFLLRHPHIFIHLREEEKQSSSVQAKRLQEGLCIRQGVLDLLGISSTRIISGPVLANKIFLPQDQGCGNFVEHPYELRQMSKILIRASLKVHCHFALRTSSDKNVNLVYNKKKNIVIHNRPCAKDTTSYIWRCFTDNAFEKLGVATRNRFPEHNVFLSPESRPEASIIMESTTNSTRCANQLACDIQQFHNTDIFIGLHGAAMTNVMFMRPGSLLVEVVGFFDGKMLPVCGIYGPLAAVFGVHHYIYFYDGMKTADASTPLSNSTDDLLDMEQLIKNVKKFYDRLY